MTPDDEVAAFLADKPPIRCRDCGSLEVRGGLQGTARINGKVVSVSVRCDACCRKQWQAALDIFAASAT